MSVTHWQNDNFAVVDLLAVRSPRGDSRDGEEGNRRCGVESLLSACPSSDQQSLLSYADRQEPTHETKEHPDGIHLPRPVHRP